MDSTIFVSVFKRFTAALENHSCACLLENDSQLLFTDLKFHFGKLLFLFYFTHASFYEKKYFDRIWFVLSLLQEKAILVQPKTHTGFAWWLDVCKDKAN